MMKSIASQPSNSYRNIFIALLTILCSSSLAQASVQQTNQAKPEAKSEANQIGIRKLEVGEPIEREMKGGESHTYEIALTKDQYLNVVVDKRGINVVVIMTGPDSKQIIEVNSSDGLQGSEQVEQVAVTGSYRLNVQSRQKGASAGRYEIRVVELRAATEDDRALEEARNLSREFERLSRAGKYDEARPLGERALAIREKALGPDHPLVAQSFNNLASLYHLKGDYAKADPLYQRSLAIREKTLGPDHTDVGDSLNNLAILYRDKGDYAKAEPLYQRSLAIREKALGADHPDVASSLHNLASLYRSKGDYARAEPLYQRALAIRERALGPDHLDVARSLLGLANLYYDKGDYAKAEPLYQRALAIREKALGPDHPDVALYLNNIASLYRLKGDYAKAEPLFQRAQAIWEKTLGPDHPNVALSLNNLANLYRLRGDYAKAEPLHQRSLAIDVTGSLNDLANLYYHKEEYAKAEPLHQRALAIWEKALGPDHPNVAGSLSNLASLYKEKGDYAKADFLFQRSLAIREKALGPNHPDIAASLNGLTRLYGAKGDIARAITFQSRASLVTERNITLNVATGSERQKLAYLATLSDESDQTISLHLQFAPTSPNALRLSINTVLRRKGRALDAMTDSISALRRRFNPQDRLLLEQLSEARSRLARLVLGGPRNDPAKYRAEVKLLEEQVEKLESDISRLSLEFRVQSQPVTLEAVQSAIPRDAALVEFASYRPFNARYTKESEAFGEPRYVAYILRSQGDSEWVELGEVKPIDYSVAKLRKALRNPRRNDVRRLARAVDEKVMMPVRKLLGPTRRLLVSPDGALNLVPFAALVDERNQFLVKRYSFTYLTSGRDLLRLQTKVPGKTAKMVIADPDFGEGKATPSSAANPSNTSSASNAASDSNRGALDDLYFAPLKATAAEARDLKRLFPDAIVMTRAQATEAALKAADRPAILHIATHGFFLSDEQQLDSQAEGEKTRIVVRRREKPQVKREDDPSQLVNPLLRSGLGLAGANQRTGSDGNDGILTAMEAAGLDLWGTKLVVLSACDTGVGELKTGDGVYGLRRALVLAGSESQMISLWPVSDTGTRELMIDYYRRLKAGEGRSQALRRVQLKMLASKNRNHPFYWASFIQSGEWANLDGKRVD